MSCTNLNRINNLKNAVYVFDFCNEEHCKFKFYPMYIQNICQQVISHKDYKSRDDFDEALHASLTSTGIDIVCLAGFMRILTGM